MAGASRRHNLIVANLLRVLGNQLVNSPCNVYPSDLRVKVAPLTKYTYPDVSIGCTPEEFEDDSQDTLLNPRVLFEVLSESTEAYDRGRKFEHYQYIDALQVYVLVSQEAPRVEAYERTHPHRWSYTEFRQHNDIVTLDVVGVSVSVAEIYMKVFDV